MSSWNKCNEPRQTKIEILPVKIYIKNYKTDDSLNLYLIICKGVEKVCTCITKIQCPKLETGG